MNGRSNEIMYTRNGTFISSHGMQLINLINDIHSPGTAFLFVWVVEKVNRIIRRRRWWMAVAKGHGQCSVGTVEYFDSDTNKD